MGRMRLHALCPNAEWPLILECLKVFGGRQLAMRDRGPLRKPRAPRLTTALAQIKRSTLAARNHSPFCWPRLAFSHPSSPPRRPPASFAQGLAYERLQVPRHTHRGRTGLSLVRQPRSCTIDMHARDARRVETLSRRWSGRVTGRAMMEGSPHPPPSPAAGLIKHPRQTWRPRSARPHWPSACWPWPAASPPLAALQVRRRRAGEGEPCLCAPQLPRTRPNPGSPAPAALELQAT